MRIDPYKKKELWLAWKRKNQDGILGLTQRNQQLVSHFLNNMEQGLNTAPGSKKGARSYGRLLSLKDRLTVISKNLQELFGLDGVIDISEEQLHSYFTDMRSGTITKRNGQPYLSTSDFVRDFKTFWHWHMKVSKKEGNQVPDICVDLDTSKAKPKWVYLTEEQIRRLCNNSKFYYKVLIMLLFDSGIRSPSCLLINYAANQFNTYLHDHQSLLYGEPKRRQPWRTSNQTTS